MVGFTYNSDGQIVRPMQPADTGARNGPGSASCDAHRYAHEAGQHASAFRFGTMFDGMRPANLKDMRGNAPAPFTTFSGVSQEALQDEDSYDRALCWRVSRPWPANVVIAGVNDDTKDQ